MDCTAISSKHWSWVQAPELKQGHLGGQKNMQSPQTALRETREWTLIKDHGQEWELILYRSCAVGWVGEGGGELGRVTLGPVTFSYRALDKRSIW